jgi:acyl-[acyl-carrier-protein]-phospholipid O-acyltransferase / long-chain-fatty-acid--[acyl-carrier-protein] ligase
MTTTSSIEPHPQWHRGFWSLMITQAQGAFSDNALKWLMIFLALGSGMSEAAQDELNTKAAAYFAIPFLLLSTYSGWLADRVSKRSVMIGVKIAEIGIMLFAAWALRGGQMNWQLFALCLMGVHSTFFAPAKYGVMPELLPTTKLSWGNGLLELLTFGGIIAGTVAGGWMAEHLGHSPGLGGLILVGVAVIGLISSLGITRVPAAAPQKKFEWNAIKSLWLDLRSARQDRDLWRAIWGNTAFFLIATMVQMNLTLHAKQDFHLSPSQQSWLQAALCLGIGVGSVIAGYWSRGKIRYGLIPLGGALMALSGIFMGWPQLEKSWFTVFLALLGVGGGLFIVPIAAVLQHRPSADQKGAIQGAASWLSWVGILVAAGLQAALKPYCTHAQFFWIAGGLALISALYVAATRRGAMRELFQRGGEA